MSAARLAANQTNAQLSTGPVTPDGKQRSSRNRLAHGFTSQQVVLPGESQDEYDELKEGLLADYKPATTTEHSMVSRLAESYWRYTRLRATETALLTDRVNVIEQRTGLTGHAALANLFIDPVEMNRMRLFLRYLTQAERAYYKALRDIEAEQKTRRRAQREQLVVEAWTAQREEPVAELQPEEHADTTIAQPHSAPQQFANAEMDLASFRNLPNPPPQVRTANAGAGAYTSVGA